jgi:YD repeat-containing protein
VETNGYSLTGNLTGKGAVTNYLYNSPHPHAVTRVTTPSGNRSFGYDGNGNLTSITGAGGNHTLTWYSDNQPRKITDAATGELSEFWYDAERSRWKQVSQSSAGSEIRYYVEGGLYEKLFAGGGFTHLHRIQVGGRTVAEVRRFTSAPEQVRWWHVDHLARWRRSARRTARSKPGTRMMPGASGATRPVWSRRRRASGRSCRRCSVATPATSTWTTSGSST